MNTTILNTIKVLLQHKINVSQAGVIAASPDVSIKEIASKLDQPYAAVAANVRKLVKRGYLKYDKESPLRVELTTAATGLLDQLNGRINS